MRKIKGDDVKIENAITAEVISFKQSDIGSEFSVKALEPVVAETLNPGQSIRENEDGGVISRPMLTTENSQVNYTFDPQVKVQGIGHATI